MNVERAVTPDWPTAMAQMALKLGEITELHAHVWLHDGTDVCWHCKALGDYVSWPCETMRIVERVAL